MKKKKTESNKESIASFNIVRGTIQALLLFRHMGSSFCERLWGSDMALVSMLLKTSITMPVGATGHFQVP